MHIILVLPSCRQTDLARVTERHICWQQGQHCHWDRNEVRAVRHHSPTGHNWIQDQEHGPQVLEWPRTDQHRNPPGVADWKRQISSDLGHPCWGLAWHWTLHPCWQYQQRPMSIFQHAIACIQMHAIIIIIVIYISKGLITPHIQQSLFSQARRLNRISVIL